jgi:branched-chain amino acid transport system substrate-binding protein
MTYEDAVPLMKAIRRRGYAGPILGTATMARSSFAELFAREPEEKRTPGFFTQGAYAVSPMILDSANADTLAFAERFRRRFGHEPSWEAVQVDDAMRLAIASLRQAGAVADIKAERLAILAYLNGLDGPAHAFAGLNGPIWFADRVRRQAVRIGRFHAGAFESAPLQLVPAPNATPATVAAGEAIEADGSYLQFQRIVYTGMFANEVSRVDLARASFGADFYVWLRYVRDAGPGAADPADITFPTLATGGFSAANKADQRDLPDGTAYRLWRVQGEFRNDFDLRRYPFDRQELAVSFFNAHAASDRIVYVIDGRACPGHLDRKGRGLTDRDGRHEGGHDPSNTAARQIPIPRKRSTL